MWDQSDQEINEWIQSMQPKFKVMTKNHQVLDHEKKIVEKKFKDLEKCFNSKDIMRASNKLLGTRKVLRGVFTYIFHTTMNQ